jgi:hypothetical protein
MVERWRALQLETAGKMRRLAGQKSEGCSGQETLQRSNIAIDLHLIG